MDARKRGEVLKLVFAQPDRLRMVRCLARDTQPGSIGEMAELDRDGELHST